MWIFTKERGAYNLDNYDRLEDSDYGTTLFKEGKPSRLISYKKVSDVIRDAFRRGDNFVEVE